MKNKLIFKIIKINYFFKNLIIRFLQYILFKKFDNQNIKRILIFRNGSLGDNICAMPSIASIRKKFPKSRIDILYNTGGFKHISIKNLIDNSLINNFINYEKFDFKEVIKITKKIKYELFIELPQTHSKFTSLIRNIVFAKIIGAKYGFGWEITVTKLFSKIQAESGIIKNVRDNFAEILTKNNIPVDKENYPFEIKKEDIELINNILVRYNLGNINKNIAVISGAKRKQNRWNIEYFREVINFFTKKGFNIILIGGKNDKKRSEIFNKIKGVYDFSGKLNPVQSGLLIKNCKITISNDTGPMHLSYAFGTFTVAIFSSRDYPNLWYPPKSKSIVLRNNNIFCNTCFSETCENNICMENIKPAAVINAVMKIIDL